MRSVGLGLALLASVQFTVVPALAADPSKAVKTAAAKKKKKAPVAVHTTSGDVPAATPPATTPPATDTPAPPAPAVEPAPATPAPEATAVPAAPATPPGSVIVHITSPKSVSLEKRSGPGSAWQHVCTSPCDVATPTSDEYQILGEDLNASTPFVLDASQGEKITLDVTPGYHNKGARAGWVVGVGAALIVGGVVTLAAGSKNKSVPGDNGTGTTHNSNDDFIWAGSVLITAGVIAALAGGAVMFDNSHTKVEGAIGAVPDQKTDVKGQVQVTAQRLPQWHEDTGPQLAQSRFVSILNGTF